MHDCYVCLGLRSRRTVITRTRHRWILLGGECVTTKVKGRLPTHCTYSHVTAGIFDRVREFDIPRSSLISINLVHTVPCQGLVLPPRALVCLQMARTVSNMVELRQLKAKLSEPVSKFQLKHIKPNFKGNNPAVI